MTFRQQARGYSARAAEAICSRLVEGETLTAICASGTLGIPRSPARVHAWLEAHEEFRLAYWRARRQQAVIWADSTIDMADAATLRDHHVVRLRIDARKWFASRLYPQLLGDRVAHQQLDARGEPTDPRSSISFLEVAIGRLDSTDLAELVRLLRLAGVETTDGASLQIEGRVDGADGRDRGVGVGEET